MYGATGGEVAAPIWNRFMVGISGDLEDVEPFETPELTGEVITPSPVPGVTTSPSPVKEEGGKEEEQVEEEAEPSPEPPPPEPTSPPPPPEPPPSTEPPPPPTTAPPVTPPPSP
jgi:membrane peptidoglycan carboxypeptidase